jgi:proteasome accessory factor A
MTRLFGIETEYGIWVEGRDAADLMDEAREVVKAHTGPSAGPWDYRPEDPRRDMRGFKVEHLSHNPQDAQYDRPGRQPMTAEEERSDRVLGNGARLYNDHGHPEYATPECRRLRDLVAYDKAGERIVLACARAVSDSRRRSSGASAPDASSDTFPGRVSLFKNNTDFHGMSYGCHEGYLVPREIPFERLFHGLMPFFVTRQIFAGAGKVGVETAGPFAEQCQFQLSQRADFFTEEASVDTLHRRPIINTRDEPHADPRAYRRFHVIVGDANLSEFATALKVGTTQLVLELIAAGWEPLFRVRAPVEAIKAVSRDPSLRWRVELEDGRTIRATDLQHLYLSDARKLLGGQDADTDWTLQEWERVLAALERDPMELESRLDWVAKRRTLETFIEAENVGWEDERLRSLDLEYHNVDPDLGLFHALGAGGMMERLVTDEDVEQAMVEPPRDTRAFIRGVCVQRFAPQIHRIGWGRVGIEEAGHTHWVNLYPFVDGAVAAVNERLLQTQTLTEVLELVSRGEYPSGVRDP